MDDLYQFGNNRHVSNWNRFMSAVAAMIARGVGHVALAAAATLTVLILSLLALVFTLLAGAPLKRLGA